MSLSLSPTLSAVVAEARKMQANLREATSGDVDILYCRLSQLQFHLDIKNLASLPISSTRFASVRYICVSSHDFDRRIRELGSPTTKEHGDPITRLTTIVSPTTPSEALLIGEVECLMSQFCHAFVSLVSQFTRVDAGSPGVG